MAEGKMIALRWMLALMLVAAPSMAMAQDASDDQGDQTETVQGDPPAVQGEVPPMDPVEALQGLWHVDRAEGSAADDTMVGGILKIEPQAIASLSGGTCSSPSFTAVPSTVDSNEIGVDITCLGQPLASARWGADSDTVNWSEPNLDVVLHRVKTAAEQEPAGASDGNYVQP